MPEAELGGVVEAEGAIGQPHPGEDEAGGSAQERQLGEHHGDERLQGAPTGVQKVRRAPKGSCRLSAEFGRGGNSPHQLRLRMEPSLGWAEVRRERQ